MKKVIRFRGLANWRKHYCFIIFFILISVQHSTLPPSSKKKSSSASFHLREKEARLFKDLRIPSNFVSNFELPPSTFHSKYRDPGGGKGHEGDMKRGATSCAPALPIKLCRRFRLNSRSCWWDARHITLKGQRDTEIVQRYKSWKEESARADSKQYWIVCTLPSEKTGKRSSVYFRRWDVSSERMCSLLKNTEPFPPVSTVKDGGNERTRWSSSGLKMTVFLFFLRPIIVQSENGFFFYSLEKYK